MFVATMQLSGSLCNLVVFSVNLLQILHCQLEQIVLLLFAFHKKISFLIRIQLLINLAHYNICNFADSGVVLSKILNVGFPFRYLC